MIKTENVISALPLVADALGRKYGVKIHIGGERAYTNGNEIHLPSLPLDADENILNLIRGYLDHEAAHIRLSDFDTPNQLNVDELEKGVWNILEDYMIERKIAEIYPGCKQNLAWLAKYLFTKKLSADYQQPAETIFNWLLRAVRTLLVPELAKVRDQSAKMLDDNFPNLRSQLEPLVASVPVDCHDTSSCMNKAGEIMAVIRQYAKNEATPKQKENKDRQNSEPELPSDNSGIKDITDRDSGTSPHSKENVEATESENSQQSEQSLEEYLASPTVMPVFDMGQQAGTLLQGVRGEKESALTMATPTLSTAKELREEEIREIRRNTVALRSRLQGLLQAKILRRSYVGRVGKIEPSRMARLAVSDPRIFVRCNVREGINTAIHILLDTSGSMQGTKIKLAINACYALASALNHIPGLSFAVTAFPGNCKFRETTGETDWNTVSPLKTWREKLHNRFNISCTGYTPMAEALWWALQDINSVKENRRIILIISDGEPQNMNEAVNAIQTHRRYGNEVYGIGIETSAMQRLVSEKYARSIYELKELAPAMFNLLGKTLTRNIWTFV